MYRSDPDPFFFRGGIQDSDPVQMDLVAEVKKIADMSRGGFLLQNGHKAADFPEYIAVFICTIAHFIKPYLDPVYL